MGGVTPAGSGLCRFLTHVSLSGFFWSWFLTCSHVPRWVVVLGAGYYELLRRFFPEEDALRRAEGISFSSGSLRTPCDTAKGIKVHWRHMDVRELDGGRGVLAA